MKRRVNVIHILFQWSLVQAYSFKTVKKPRAGTENPWSDQYWIDVWTWYRPKNWVWEWPGGGDEDCAPEWPGDWAGEWVREWLWGRVGDWSLERLKVECGTEFKDQEHDYNVDDKEVVLAARPSAN